MNVRFGCAVAAVLLVMPQPARAASCYELLTRCKAEVQMFTGDPFCDEQLRDVLKQGVRICVANGRTVDIEAAFVRWADAHPEVLKTNSSECMSEALKESFPCD
jgi:hypothetical protein